MDTNVGRGRERRGRKGGRDKKEGGGEEGGNVIGGRKEIKMRGRGGVEGGS